MELRQRGSVLDCGGCDTVLELSEEIAALESGVAFRLPPHAKTWRQPGGLEKVK